MRRFRVSIAALLVGIALLGVTLTALIHPSPLWANSLYSLTLATLTLAVLGAIYGRGAARAFRVGFATCGWAYFLAIYGPEPISNVGPNLVTTSILDIIYPYTVPRSADPSSPTAWESRTPPPKQTESLAILLVGAFGGSTGPPLPPPTTWQVLTRPDRTTQFNQASPRLFRRVGHSFFCLAFAMLGGLMTRRFYEGRERARVAA